ncbi:MAG: DNA-directed RNA polymerase subunit delta [Coprobacillus sp.]|nr:DNA-directed RNA polymerase subunit delta [Coprobacillus sp.]MDY4144721.1 DNA-directed RNA polymerase subunit delta [Bacilli bacterium]
MYENDSLLEIAKELMEKKRKPHSIQNLAKEVFELKGLKVSDNLEMYSQFVNDFMLCGYFICCGEDKKGVKLWDLKSRQRHELLEKDGAYLDDPYGDDEDVVNNELKDDDYYYGDSKDSYDNQFDDEDDDEEDDDEEEKDDIEEELLFGNGYDVDEEDDDDEDGYDDDEELTIKPKKK